MCKHVFALQLYMLSEVVRGLIKLQMAVSQVPKWHCQLKVPK